MTSIIIPTRGRGESLERCLASIKEHTTNYEVIIVDIEGGLNEKKNYGARLAMGDTLVFLHDDVEVTAGWLDETADVGGFCYGELGGKFYVWGGLGAGYCSDNTTNPDYTDFLLLSRRAYAKIGPFDEFYKEPGHQDADFGKQIAAAGYTITPLKGKIVHHALNAGHLRPENETYFKEKWGV